MPLFVKELLDVLPKEHHPLWKDLFCLLTLEHNTTYQTVAEQELDFFNRYSAVGEKLLTLWGYPAPLLIELAKNQTTTWGLIEEFAFAKNRESFLKLVPQSEKNQYALSAHPNTVFERLFLRQIERLQTCFANTQQLNTKLPNPFGKTLRYLTLIYGDLLEQKQKNPTEPAKPAGWWKKRRFRKLSTVQ